MAVLLLAQEFDIDRTRDEWDAVWQANPDLRS